MLPASNGFQGQTRRPVEGRETTASCRSRVSEKVLFITIFGQKSQSDRLLMIASSSKHVEYHITQFRKLLLLLKNIQYLVLS